MEENRISDQEISVITANSSLCLYSLFHSGNCFMLC